MDRASLVHSLVSSEAPSEVGGGSAGLPDFEWSDFLRLGHLVQRAREGLLKS